MQPPSLAIANRFKAQTAVHRFAQGGGVEQGARIAQGLRLATGRQDHSFAHAAVAHGRRHTAVVDAGGSLVTSGHKEHTLSNQRAI